MIDGLRGLRLGRFNRRFNRRQVVAVRHPLHMPVVGLKPLQRILGIAQLRRPIQRDQVVVVDKDQLAQPQRSGQRSRLVRHPFHQVAIAQQRIGVVIHHLKSGPVVDRCQVLLRHRHAHRHRDALSQRPGRHFHAVRVPALRVARRLRAPLPEALQVVQRHVVAGQKQRRVEQRRRVSIRKHKPVPIRPLRVRRIVLHQLVKQQVRNRRAAQRRSRVAAVGLLHRIHGQQPQRVNGQLIKRYIGRTGRHRNSPISINKTV